MPSDLATLAPAELDTILTAQLIVAWAGESTPDDRRLAWWDTDLASEFGGEDFYRRLLPQTWPWAIHQSTREAARRVDASARQKDADPDRILSLFNLGFELDEQLDERLADLKRQAQPPLDALPGLSAVIDKTWSPDRFEAWARAMTRPDTETTSVGRRIRGTPPSTPSKLVATLVAALVPVAPAYPLPHYRRA